MKYCELYKSENSGFAWWMDGADDGPRPCIGSCVLRLQASDSHRDESVVRYGGVMSQCFVVINSTRRSSVRYASVLIPSFPLKKIDSTLT